MGPGPWGGRFQVNTREFGAGQARLAASVVVRNAGRPVRERIALAIDGQEVHAESREIPAGASTLQFEAVVSQPRLWSPEEPNLYSARVSAGGDDQFTRFGIHSVGVDGSKILWNGRPDRKSVV